MVIIKDDSYLIKSRVDVGQYFGVKSWEAYIELREPTNKDLIKLKDSFTAGEDAMLTVMGEILPRIIVQHNLYSPAAKPEDEPKLMSAAEVSTLVLERLGIYAEVVEKLSKTLVFIQGSKSAATSGTSPEGSSEAS